MKTAVRVLIADNYDSFVFNLAQAFGALGVRVDVLRSDAIDVDRVASMPPDALVISPGPGRPDAAGCSVALVRVLSGHVPILGVCLGHEAIGEAFGARITRAPAPVHGKPSMVEHQEHPLFNGVPSPFVAGRYHSLVVDGPSLSPTPLEAMACDEEGLVMAVRHSTHPTYGLQFHPESILTAHGPRIIANFLREVETRL